MKESMVEQVCPAGAQTQQRLRERLADIQAMPVSELQDLYCDLHGRATRARNRAWLIKRLSYKTQEIITGRTLSAEAQQRIVELGKDQPVRQRDIGEGTPLPKPQAASRDPRLPPVGTVIRRTHKGVVHEITVLEDGFDYDGQHYANLSAIARKVTGTQWNGFLWAGLTSRKQRSRTNENQSRTNAKENE